MSTVITGVFRDHLSALKAAVQLEDAGFRRSNMRVVDLTTPDRHAFVQRRVADTRRGILLGVTAGALLGAIAGLALAGVFGTAATILAGAVGGAVGGTVLGFFVGRATTTQMTDELEHHIDSGAVVIRLFVDAAQASEVLGILAEHSDAQITATAATFTSGVAPRSHGHGVAIEQRWRRVSASASRPR